VTSVAFSPDGTLLASGSADHTIKLWNVVSGTELQTLKGYTGDVFSVAFSPNSRQIASGNADGTIRIWNLDLDQLLVLGCEWLQGYLCNPTVNIRDRDWVQGECKQILDNEPQKKKLARQDQREFQVQMRWGKIHTMQGRYEQAIEAYKQALALRPDLPEVWLNMAKTHETFDHTDLAIEAYRHAVGLNPGSEDGWYGLMYGLYSQGKLDEAQAAYQKLFKIDPTYRFAERIVEDVGYALWTQGKLDEAAALYATALHEDPNDLDFLGKDAALALLQDDIPRCKKRLAAAKPFVESSSDDSVILLFLAWLAKPEQGFDAVVTAIESLESGVRISWDSSYFEPAIARQDKQTQHFARTFIAFFEEEIDLPELKRRLAERENDRD
jgi:tetratricopeptide (TPR) repeat protein